MSTEEQLREHWPPDLNDLFHDKSNILALLAKVHEVLSEEIVDPVDLAVFPSLLELTENAGLVFIDGHTIPRPIMGGTNRLIER